jgi:hypothetical protein
MAKITHNRWNILGLVLTIVVVMIIAGCGHGGGY